VTAVKLDLTGLEKPGKYPVRVETVECHKGRDLIWTLRITDGPDSGEHIRMVTPIDAASQVWLLKKALVNLGVLEHASDAVVLDIGDDGKLVEPAVMGRTAIARVRRMPKGPRIELLRPKEKKATSAPVA
jgi:hypothetical protein